MNTSLPSSITIVAVHPDRYKLVTLLWELDPAWLLTLFLSATSSVQVQDSGLFLWFLDPEDHCGIVPTTTGKGWNHTRTSDVER